MIIAQSISKALRKIHFSSRSLSNFRKYYGKKILTTDEKNGNDAPRFKINLNHPARILGFLKLKCFMFQETQNFKSMIENCKKFYQKDLKHLVEL